MPFVTVQLGQCGNQLGTAFFKSLIEDAFTNPKNCSRQSEEDYQCQVIGRYGTWLACHFMVQVSIV